MRKIPLIPYIYNNVNENSTNPAQKKNMQVNIKAKIGFTIKPWDFTKIWLAQSSYQIPGVYIQMFYVLF